MLRSDFINEITHIAIITCVDYLDCKQKLIKYWENFVFRVWRLQFLAFKNASFTENSIFITCKIQFSPKLCRNLEKNSKEMGK